MLFGRFNQFFDVVGYAFDVDFEVIISGNIALNLWKARRSFWRRAEKSMSVEIERKFLLKNLDWKKEAVGIEICQGYVELPNGDLRVRIYGEKAFLTVKSKQKSERLTRLEFEYEIPVSDARGMLENICQKPYIQKYRYKVQFGDKLWEIDEFFGENSGLIVAEIELESECESFEKPSWIGEEVSSDFRYYNSNLVQNPYCNWKS